MIKLYRNFLMAGVVSLALAACGDDLTILEPTPPPPPPPGPVVPNITTFSVTPGAATIAPGGFVAASATLITKPGVTGSVAWTSSNPAVAAISNESNNGVTITAVSVGSAVVTATATADGETASAAIGVTVRPLQPAQISIQSITTANLGTPVNVGNVMGQIEVNMNFDPGEETVDSVAFYIGNVQAASQTYTNGPAPAAGLISLSTNTAHYTKNVGAGTTTVRFPNGPTTISAAVYRAGQPPIATNQVAIVLNNADGWAADMSKPANSANNSGGVTYWGGPGADGVTTTTLYPVIYTPGREVTSVTFRVGHIGGAGCTPGVTLTELPFTASFGYGDVADFDCSGYEWPDGGIGGQRDNIVFMGALDNQSTPFPAFMPLISNSVVLGSTPDSLRFDWDGPDNVSIPNITRTAPAVTGWVNASTALGSTQSDNGVGVASSTGTSVFYNAPNCDGSEDNPVPSKTGADIPECGSNFIGGTPGLGGTAPYRVYATGVDRLGNTSVSAMSPYFGVDKTAPAIRWGIESAAPALVASAPADTIYHDGTPVKPASGVDLWRAEYIDERSGFYNNGLPLGGVAAQRHAVSTAGHMNNVGACLVGSGPIGAAFVTAPTCSMTAITTGGPIRVDGWQAGMDVDVPVAEGYYGYRTDVSDAAGNRSEVLFTKALVNVMSPFATGLSVPAQITEDTMGFIATLADSAEAIAYSMRMDYPALPTSADVRYPTSDIGITFDDAITSPFNGPASPATGAPYAKRIEVVTGDTWDGVTPFPPTVSNIDAGGLDPANLANVKPINAQVWSWNTGSLITGGPAPSNSPLIPIPALLVTDGVDMADWNAANPTIRVNYWRVITTVANTNQFNSTEHLRAQAVAPTNAPNPPFARVDFYRLVGGTTWSYLGSDATPVAADQGTFRSWVWSKPTGSFVTTWDGQDQVDAAAGDVIIAVGVTSTGEGLSTVATTMTP